MILSSWLFAATYIYMIGVQTTCARESYFFKSARQPIPIRLVRVGAVDPYGSSADKPVRGVRAPPLQVNAGSPTHTRTVVILANVDYTVVIDSRSDIKFYLVLDSHDLAGAHVRSAVLPRRR